MVNKEDKVRLMKTDYLVLCYSKFLSHKKLKYSTQLKMLLIDIYVMMDNMQFSVKRKSLKGGNRIIEIV